MIAAVSRWVIFNYGFRSFFLCCSLFAVVSVLAWLLLLQGYSWPGAPLNPLLWHSHEMLYGFVGAAIAGFLLTAVPNWTGQPPLQGKSLALLTLAWLAGRLAMAHAGHLPGLVVSVLDIAFPLGLTLAVGHSLIRTGNRRNFPLLIIIAFFPLSDLLFHLGYLGVTPGTEQALNIVPHLAALLVAIIGGRIIPSFTTSWMRAQNIQELPQSHPWLDRCALIFTVLSGIAVLLAPDSTFTGIVALLTAVAHALRLAGWRGLQTLTNPLLAVLHFGYAWLAMAYLMIGLANFITILSYSTALHALTIGALGTMIMAVMSRVALGHTGRALRVNRLTILAYLMLSLSALMRLAMAFASSAHSMLMLISATTWIVGFTFFMIVYWPILTRPRIDGKPERQIKKSATNSASMARS